MFCVKPNPATTSAVILVDGHSKLKVGTGGGLESTPVPLPTLNIPPPNNINAKATTTNIPPKIKT